MNKGIKYDYTKSFIGQNFLIKNYNGYYISAENKYGNLVQRSYRENIVDDLIWISETSTNTNGFIFLKSKNNKTVIDVSGVNGNDILG